MWYTYFFLADIEPVSSLRFLVDRLICGVNSTSGVAAVATGSSLTLVPTIFFIPFIIPVKRSY